MIRFQLNDCSVSFRIEPLQGELQAADRVLAWRVYLALVTRAALRVEQMPERELQELIGSLESLLGEWPASRIEAPAPAHLGFVIVAVIETVLLPCLEYGRGASAGWRAVREFCDALAREIALTYRLPDAGANVPRDLLAAWHP